MTSPEKKERADRPGRGGLLGLKVLLAVAAPFVALGALEGALRLAGYGVSTNLFIPEREPGFYRTNPQFTAPFVPASFGIHPLSFRLAKHKAPNALRVFVVGESAAQGMPEPDFGFAAMLRSMLRTQFPGREVELYNLGITAINSHVVRRAVIEAAAFEPDLFVVYMGNNEVVGPYGPGCAYLSKAPPLGIIRASVWVRGTRTGQLLATLFARLAPAGSRALEWQGMETFAGVTVPGDDPRLETVYATYSSNLRDILEAARRSGAKVVLSTVAANIDACAPFISRHRPGLSAAEAKAWSAAYDAGVVAADLLDDSSAAPQFAAAARIDPQYADLAFRLGQIARTNREGASARRHFLEALHWDALRFRPDPRINAIIRDAARGAGDSVVLVDAAGQLGSAPDAPASPVGSPLFLDHVHFTANGNEQVAELLDAACLRQLAAPGAPAPPVPSPAETYAALGFTSDIELRMYQTMVELTLRPPFTGQMTFSRNQATLRAWIGTTEARSKVEGPVPAEATVAAAAARDPRNPALLAHLADLEAALGHPAAARDAIERAVTLEPDSVERSIAQARILARDLATAAQAENILRAALEKDPEYFSAGTPLIDLWAQRGELEVGRRVLSGLLERHPRNPYLRLEYANLLAREGEEAGAEREARAVWEASPAGRPAMAALELRVRLDERAGRKEEADRLSLDAVSLQPDDYFNNERVARIYDARGDKERAATALLAVAASGPFAGTQHLDLAHRLADLGRNRDLVEELARARDVYRIEGNAEGQRLTESLIGQYRRRFSATPGTP